MDYLFYGVNGDSRGTVPALRSEMRAWCEQHGDDLSKTAARILNAWMYATRLPDPSDYPDWRHLDSMVQQTGESLCRAVVKGGLTEEVICGWIRNWRLSRIGEYIAENSVDGLPKSGS